ncbi:MAG: hypothetical protein BWY75_02821 [bacterium ADurb.Bin425]|nr:MAG: hypothetical protein BWY75_02821 [bacterium ADurb.Bin425]
MVIDKVYRPTGQISIGCLQTTYLRTTEHGHIGAGTGQISTGQPPTGGLAFLLDLVGEFKVFISQNVGGLFLPGRQSSDDTV